jgi:rRNA maturation protein Rpf1
MDGVAEKALECDADRVIIVDRGQGGPSKIELFQIGESGLISVFPIFSFFSIQLQREFEPKRLKPIRSIAITIPSKGNEEIIRVANSLSQFFNIPIFSANEKPSMYMAKMPISYDSSGRIQITFNAQNIETGPRITLSGILWKKSK